MQKQFSINISEIKEKSRLKSEENQQFKAFLRNFPSQEIDTKVFTLAQEVSANIDCLACANCCRNLEPELKKEEIPHLAALKGIEITDFKQEYIHSDKVEDIDFLKKKPCIFLANTACTIYSERPFSCADYPHLYKPHFKYRLKSIFRNYEMCPIVFHTIEQLKENLSFSNTTNQNESL